MEGSASGVGNDVISKARNEPGFVDFVHLHNHTHYSLLDGLQKVPQLIDRIEQIGQSSVAITDHGTLGGAIEFYKACKDRGIRPIIGLETYVSPRKHTDKTLSLNTASKKPRWLQEFNEA